MRNIQAILYKRFSFLEKELLAEIEHDGLVNKIEIGEEILQKGLVKLRRNEIDFSGLLSRERATGREEKKKGAGS